MLIFLELLLPLYFPLIKLILNKIHTLGGLCYSLKLIFFSWVTFLSFQIEKKQTDKYRRKMFLVMNIY